jgi:hypothetical protein
VLVADIAAVRRESISALCHRAIELHPGIAILLTADITDWRPSGSPARSEFLIRPFGIDALLAGIRVAMASAACAGASGRGTDGELSGNG